jgi:hypothetical protein
MGYFAAASSICQAQKEENPPVIIQLITSGQYFK